MLTKVIGQEAAKKQIVTAWRNDRLHHAYLLSGDEGLGAEELAIEATRLFMCENPDREKYEPCGECPNCKKISGFQHADVHYYFPVMRSTEDDEIRALLDAKSGSLYARARVGGGSIPIGDMENPETHSIRGLSRAISLRSYEGKLKIFILTFVEDMNAEATNALLKILEEPPPQTLYFLTTGKIHTLLPTVISRCQLVKLHRLTEQEVIGGIRGQFGKSESDARLIAKLANGSFYAATQLITGDLDKKREAMLDFLLAAVSPKLNGLQNNVSVLIETAEKDKTFFTDVLSIMITWFQDVFYLNSVRDEPELLEKLVVNHDKRDRLDKFAKAFPKARIEEAVNEIEKAVDLIGRNVYINLILMNLGLNLREAINPVKTTP